MKKGPVAALVGSPTALPATAVVTLSTSGGPLHATSCAPPAAGSR